jgi:alginate O-acetyltransferase complex protein AlgI
VIIAWVFFRAQSAPAAMSVLASMCGFNGVSLPSRIETLLPASIGTSLLASGVSFNNMFNNELLNWNEFPYWAAALSLFVLAAPNTYQLMSRYHPALMIYRGSVPPRRWFALEWQPTQAWSLALAVLAFAAFTQLAHVTRFIYFQF